MDSITQADRDRAAALYDSMRKASPPLDWQADWMREGTADYGPVVQAFAAHRRTAQAELVALLREVEIVLALVEKPAFPDPDNQDSIEALGDAIGYGSLMAGASAAWRARLAKHGCVGGEFVAGPCFGTVQKTLTDIRAALSKYSTDGGA